MITNLKISYLKYVFFFKDSNYFGCYIDLDPQNDLAVNGLTYAQAYSLVNYDWNLISRFKSIYWFKNVLMTLDLCTSACQSIDYSFALLKLG